MSLTNEELISEIKRIKKVIALLISTKKKFVVLEAGLAMGYIDFLKGQYEDKIVIYEGELNERKRSKKN